MALQSMSDLWVESDESNHIGWGRAIALASSLLTLGSWRSRRVHWLRVVGHALYNIAKVSLSRCSMTYFADRRNKMKAMRKLLSSVINDDLKVLLADKLKDIVYDGNLQAVVHRVKQ